MQEKFGKPLVLYPSSRAASLQDSYTAEWIANLKSRGLIVDACTPREQEAACRGSDQMAVILRPVSLTDDGRAEVEIYLWETEETGNVVGRGYIYELQRSGDGIWEVVSSHMSVIT